MKNLVHCCSVLFLSLMFISSCKKEEKKSAPVTPPPPSPAVDYRDKYLGLYTGAYLGWSWSAPNFTLINNFVVDSSFTDSIFKHPYSDSVIVSRAFGSFTLSSLGNSSLSPAPEVYKYLRFSHDTLFYKYDNYSPLGGDYGNTLNAKKHP